MSDAAAALVEVERQRGRLGERFRLPAWYVLLYGAGAASMLAAVPAMMLLDGAVVVMVVLQLLGVLGLSTPAYVVPRLTGVRLPFAASSAYPSMPRTVWLQVGSLMAGTLGVLLLSLGGLAHFALVAALLGGAGAGTAIRYVYLGIGRDIAEGRTRA